MGFGVWGKPGSVFIMFFLIPHTSYLIPRTSYLVPHILLNWYLLQCLA